MSRYDVLVVDDEQVVCDGVERILKIEGYRIDSCLDVETALKKLEEAEYSVVITDLMLPGISGMEFIGLLRQRYPEIPSIMITGYVTLRNAVDSLRAGACDYVMKPFTYDEIASVARRGLARAALGRQTRGVVEVGERPAGGYLLGEVTWAREAEEGSYLIGVDRLYLDTVGEVSRVDFSQVAEEVEQGGLCAQLGAAAHPEIPFNLWSPLSGRVIEFHEEINERPTLLRDDPYGEGWLVRLLPTNLDDELAYLVPVAARA